MEIREFNKNVSEGKFSNLYFFFGNEEYLKELYIKRLITAVVPKGTEAFNLFVFKENGEIRDIMNAVEQIPVMNEYKAVYLDNIDIFKRDSAFRDGLMSCISDIPPYTVLIIRENKIDEKTKLGKEIKKLGAVIKCEYPSSSDMRAFIAREFKKSGKKISASNADKIINECEKDMYAVSNLISSVSAYMREKEEVTEDLLNLFIVKSVDSAIYDLTDSVVTGNAKKAYEILNGLTLFPKNTPQSLFTAISNHIMSLYIIKTCRKAGIGSNEMLSYLSGKFPPFLINKYTGQLKNIQEDTLDRLLCFCADADYKLKNGLIEDKFMPIYEVIAMLSNVK